MNRAKKNVIVALVIASLFVFFFNCGDDNRSSNNLIGDFPNNRGSLKIDLKFPFNTGENQKNQKFFTWGNIASDNIPEPSELNYRIEVVSQDLTSSYEFFASYNFLNDGSTALIDLEPGNVTVTVEAYIPEADALGDMIYMGSENVVIVAGYTVTLEILLNEVADEINSPGLNIDIEINNNPVIDSVMVSSLLIEESESFNYSAVAHDPDGDVLNCTWKLDGEPMCFGPDGCTSNLPENVYIGEHLFSVEVTDNRGGIATVDFQLTVYSNDSSDDSDVPSPLFPLSPL